jgi:hypothetical protein
LQEAARAQQQGVVRADMRQGAAASRVLNVRTILVGVLPNDLDRASTTSAAPAALTVPFTELSVR